MAVVGCNEVIDIPTLTELNVSSSYVSIDKNGGSSSIDLTATESWAFDAAKIPSWLTISPVSGGAGDFKIQFTADATTKTRKIADLPIIVAGKTQYINVEQSIGIVPVSNATCAEVIAGADGKTFRVKGVVKSIAETTYGNWYLADETGEIYIYGTLDKNGGSKNFLSWGLEVGDVVTVEGPKTTYNGTVELVDVTVVAIEKSLINAVDKEVTAPKDGGIVNIDLICKGSSVNFDIPSDIQSWVSVQAISPKSDTTVVSLNVAPNEGGARSTDLIFTTTASGKLYSTQVTLKQEGAIVEVTVADFLAQPVSATALYKISGKVKQVVNATYGNFYLEDNTGYIYVYGLTATPQPKNDKSFSSLGIKEGDMVTLIGNRGQYANSKIEDQREQVSLGYHVMHSLEVTVAEFLNAPVSNDVWYRLTGNITNIANTTYGNLDITDETGTTYIYGLTSTYAYNFVTGKHVNDKKFADLGLAVGDKISVCCRRGEYKGSAQGLMGFFAGKVE